MMIADPDGNTIEFAASSVPKNSRRIRITLAYDGTDFHGWQIEPGLPRFRATVEDIVSGIEGRAGPRGGPPGRTDAGVHARAQVAAFHRYNPIPTDNLDRGLNRLLPAPVRVLGAEEVASEFHPRFDSLYEDLSVIRFSGRTLVRRSNGAMFTITRSLNETAMADAARRNSIGTTRFHRICGGENPHGAGGRK